MTELIQKLNRNKFFKFISSVKLAVPLMLALAALVAWGTVIESMYNAEYASILLYKSSGFGALLILLWINIFAATLSRIPFKKHHTGFVITHIGLLTLLIGGYITNTYGIDGQLAIAEKDRGSTVILPNLMIGYQVEGSSTPQKILFNKMIREKSNKELGSINDQIEHLFQLDQYLPFAKISKSYVTHPSSAAEALSFILKSQFFNVSEWLHSESSPVLNMGPATLKIIRVESLETDPRKSKPGKKSASSDPTLPVQKPIKTKTTQLESIADSTTRLPAAVRELEVVDAKSQKKLQKISLAQLTKSPVVINGVTISLKESLEHASVAGNKIGEGDPSSPLNPALVLMITKGSETQREVVYAKFAGFSIHPEGVFGLKFSYLRDDVEIKQAPANHGGGNNSGAPSSTQSKAETSTSQQMSSDPSSAAADSGMDLKGKNNTIIFAVSPKSPGMARVTLVKNDQILMSEILKEGQKLDTPWMGIQIFLGSVVHQAIEETIAEPMTPEKGAPLPPAAVKVRLTETNKTFWLSEGEQQPVNLMGKNAAIYFGRQTLELPFELRLEKFSKKDYPGTETPMAYESLVEIGNTGITRLIAMNEPLKHLGFTIYQASFQQSPQMTVSIFSVNQDPGRPFKYIGSLILSLGIIIFTVMRSSFWKKRNL